MSQENQKWFQENASRFSGQLLFDEPLSRHTYYRIGGPAAIFAVPKTLEDLQWLAEGIASAGVSFFILGLGSNLLISDSGFNGLIIRANRINLELHLLTQVSNPSSSSRLRTGSSVAISSLLRMASHEGWGGLEFLTGIPGSIGGAVTMNAGTHLGEVQSRLRKVEIFPLAGPGLAQAVNQSGIICFEGAQLQFQYRRNLFLPKGSFVWAAEWEVDPSNPKEVKERIDQTLARRKATQPLDYPSCGSVFKNPKSSGVLNSLSAWQVVDQLGLRGHREGGAQFSDKHSNFILNLGNAKASDVLALIQLAKTRAEKELGVQLEEEVIFVEAI